MLVLLEPSGHSSPALFWSSCWLRDLASLVPMLAFTRPESDCLPQLRPAAQLQPGSAAHHTTPSSFPPGLALCSHCHTVTLCHTSHPPTISGYCQQISFTRTEFPGGLTRVTVTVSQRRTIDLTASQAMARTQMYNFTVRLLTFSASPQQGQTSRNLSKTPDLITLKH